MGGTYRIGADLHTLHTRWRTAPWDLPGHLPPRDRKANTSATSATPFTFIGIKIPNTAAECQPLQTVLCGSAFHCGAD